MEILSRMESIVLDPKTYWKSILTAQQTLRKYVRLSVERNLFTTIRKWQSGHSHSSAIRFGSEEDP